MQASGEDLLPSVESATFPLMRNSPNSLNKSRLGGERREFGVDFQAPRGLKLWRGASGRSYLHLVYGLVGCPAFDHGSYLLVSHSLDGRRRRVHGSGRSSAEAASQNLAQVRQHGATLGATEVHLLVTADHAAAMAAEFDIISALPDLSRPSESGPQPVTLLCSE